MELVSVKNTLEKVLNQIENRFVHLEVPQNKRYGNDDDYYYGPDY